MRAGPPPPSSSTHAKTRTRVRYTVSMVVPDGAEAADEMVAHLVNEKRPWGSRCRATSCQALAGRGLDRVVSEAGRTWHNGGGGPQVCGCNVTRTHAGCFTDDDDDDEKRRGRVVTKGRAVFPSCYRGIAQVRWRCRRTTGLRCTCTRF